MNLKSIEAALRSYSASGHRDVAMTALLASSASLEAQQRTADQKHTDALRAYTEWQRRAEAALAQGEAVDQSARNRLRKAVTEAEDDAQLVSNALAHVRRDIATATAARAQRDESTLRPIFAELLALTDARAEELVQATDLLTLAHQVATGVLPGATSDLQGGFAGLLNRHQLEAWRKRAEAAGLLTPNRLRVA